MEYHTATFTLFLEKVDIFTHWLDRYDAESLVEGYNGELRRLKAKEAG